MSISIFTDPVEVYTKVAQKLPGKTVNKDDIFEWCIDAELNVIKDGDLHAKYEDIPVVIDKTLNMGALPCNIIRILEVYDENQSNIDYQITASNHIKIKDFKDKVYISYLGAYLDEEGAPRIYSSHVNALVTYCITQCIEPDVLMGKLPLGLLQSYQQKFSNQVTAIKQSATHKDIKHYDNVNVIRFNMLKKVGQDRLFKNIFK